MGQQQLLKVKCCTIYQSEFLSIKHLVVVVLMQSSGIYFLLKIMQASVSFSLYFGMIRHYAFIKKIQKVLCGIGLDFEN